MRARVVGAEGALKELGSALEKNVHLCAIVAGSVREGIRIH